MVDKAGALQHSGRILVVEDNVLFRFMVSEHLRRLGFTVDDVSTATEAREAITRGGIRYKLVVADIHLPDSTGIDLSRAMHELKPELPFVFITGDDDESLARRALLEHPAGYLIKPFELTELDAVVLHTVQTPQRKPVENVRGLQEPGLPYPVLVLKSPRNQPDRKSSAGLYIKLAIAVGVILLAAFLLGHFLGPDAPRPLDADPAPATGQ